MSGCLFSKKYRKSKILTDFFCTWKNHKILLRFENVFKNSLFNNFVFML